MLDLSQIICVIIGAIIGAGAGIIISNFTIRKQEKLKALAEFRSIFIGDICYLENADEKKEVITKYLKSSEPKYRCAIEIVLPYLKPSERDMINKAYEKYRNPIDPKEHDLLVDSFGVYDCDKEDFKNSCYNNISGRDLAIKNLNKIVYAVKVYPNFRDYPVFKLAKKGWDSMLKQKRI